MHFTSDGVAGKVIFDSGLPNASDYLSAMSDVFGQFKGESAFSNENVNLVCGLVLNVPLGVCRRMGWKSTGGIEAYKGKVIGLREGGPAVAESVISLNRKVLGLWIFFSLIRILSLCLRATR